MVSKDTDQLPDSPIQEELESKVREMLGPDFTSAPATLDKPAELQAAEEADNTPQNGGDPDVDSDDDKEDPVTERAVHEIELSESDRLLEAEDKELQAAFEPQKPGFAARINNAWREWWTNPVKRNLTIGLLVVGLITAMILPKSRYTVLNLTGVRASSTLTVIDAANQQPLKNALVKVGDVSGQTDSEGAITLRGLRLGSATLTVHKRAYAEVNRSVTIGWGSNPLGDLQLSASGEQLSFVVVDYLSNKPIANAEASVGGSDAVADDNGRVLLATEPGDETKEVTISAKAYRDEKIQLEKEPESDALIRMVPSRKSVFISKRSGKYDLYKVDVDGQNEQLVLAGSGVERADIAVLSHPTEEVLALVSTRENVHNRDGYLLSTLTLVELKSNSSAKIAQAENVKLLGWSGDKLYYTLTASGNSAANPERQKIFSYDYAKSKTTLLASADYFNASILADGTLYYSPSGAYYPDKVGLFKIGTSDTPQKIQSKEVYGVYRLAYDKLTLSVDSVWHEYALGQSTTVKIAGTPASLSTRLYTDSPDGSKSVWVDQRDGKGVLLLYNKAAKEDTVIQNVSGLQGPVRWLSDKTLIYRVVTASETADYAYNLEGGEALKIRDVTLTLDLTAQ